MSALARSSLPPEDRYRPPLLEALAQAAGAQDLRPADLTGRFVQSDRNAVTSAGARPDWGVLEGGRL